MLQNLFPTMMNKICNHRYLYLVLSFFEAAPPPVWTSRKNVWQIADGKYRILDIGCGYAHLTRSSTAQETIAVDLDRNALSFANKYGKNNFGAVYASATHLPFQNQMFDAIIATEIIEHIKEDITAVSEFSRALVPKGALFVTTPNGEATGIISPGHIREYTEKQLTNLLTQHFKIKQLKKRLGKSYAICIKVTDIVGSKVRFTTNDPRGAKFQVVTFLCLMTLAPIINLMESFELRFDKGKYNFTAICEKY